jgi:predicted HNH restriction endonuclease
MIVKEMQVTIHNLTKDNEAYRIRNQELEENNSKFAGGASKAAAKWKDDEKKYKLKIEELSNQREEAGKANEKNQTELATLRAKVWDMTNKLQAANTALAETQKLLQAAEESKKT